MEYDDGSVTSVVQGDGWAVVHGDDVLPVVSFGTVVWCTGHNDDESRWMSTRVEPIVWCCDALVPYVSHDDSDHWKDPENPQPWKLERVEK